MLFAKSLPRLTGIAQTVFAYHLVSDQPVPHLSPIYPHKTRSQFATDLELIKQMFTLAEIDRLTREKAPDLAARSAIVTFDDGLAQCFSNVRPVLDACGVRAIFFVTTDLIDNQVLMYRHIASMCLDHFRRSEAQERAVLRGRAEEICGASVEDDEEMESAIKGMGHQMRGRLEDLCRAWGLDPDEYLKRERPYMTKTELKTLAAEGHVIGAHGIDHRNLKDCDEHEVRRQVVESCRWVADLTGQSVVPFACPFSMPADPSRLERIQAREDVVGAVFGTRGVFSRPPGIFERVIADRTQGCESGRSNLPMLLARAYAFEVRARLGIGHRLQRLHIK